MKKTGAGLAVRVSGRVQASVMLGLLLLTGLTGAIIPAVASALNPVSVYVVRHAEKGVDDANDPSLSVAGAQRADALALALADAGVGTIITTHLKRTQATAAPLAARLGIKPVVLTVKRGEGAAHIDDVVAAVEQARRRQKGAVLIVGHSNTVPQIVTRLSSVPMAAICDSEYADLLVISLPAAEKEPARLTRARYGAADTAGGADCR